MRKIILNLAVSLDGFIEGPSGEYDWCFVDEDYGMTEFLGRIDTLLMGRKSYQTLKDSGEDPFATKHKIIVSKTIKSLADNETVISDDLIAAIEQLKISQGKDIWLYGGAQLTEALLLANLVDEMQLAVHPLLLGGGTRLFRDLPERIKLDLVHTKSYKSGLVQLFYRPSI
ncbi:MAG: dihydrofolate reductase [Candidatus Obscuribacter sp.]|nr:dihydrofolate reductase [Candidatus Obscuribacter sp.]